LSAGRPLAATRYGEASAAGPATSGA